MIFKKWWFWLLLIISILVIIGYMYFIKFYKNLKFNFKLGGNLGNILSALENANTPNANTQRGLGIYIDVPYKTIIDNANKVGINLKDVFAKVSYLGEDVLQTKPDSPVLRDVNIPANAKMFEINDTIQVLINPNTIKLIKALINKAKPQVDITLRGKALGFPVDRTFKQELEY